MEYRVANVIVDSEENIVYEGENVKVTFDDGSVVCGTVESIFVVSHRADAKHKAQPVFLRLHLIPLCRAQLHPSLS